MDTKDKDKDKGTAATASKMAANKKQTGGESPSPGQGATSSQNQGGTQNQGATGTRDQSASITPQQSHGAVGASQQNQGKINQEQNQSTPNSGGQDLRQQAKQTTNEVVNQVQQQANSQINRQKENAASELTSVVNAVRRFGESLNKEGQGPIARAAAQYGNKAADSLDRVARYLREQDPKQVFNDVQNFGRRQPALLIGGAFLLGFAGARIIKSSMDAASNSMNTGGQRATNQGTRSSANPGAQQPQSFNPNVSGAQRSSPPPPNQGL
ncbi:MAG TPA: hypothetical protein VN659_08845 [Pyrinomonadaceae bacterium]|nr:hypothetical protein [Pyrinomonadaceae bacterium]